MNKVNLAAAVANHGGAMEAYTMYGEHSRAIKHGDSPKNLSSRRNLFIFVCFALMAVFIGCNGKEEEDIFIDKKLHGKWELKSFTNSTSGRTWNDFPYDENPEGLNIKSVG